MAATKLQRSRHRPCSIQDSSQRPFPSPLGVSLGRSSPLGGVFGFGFFCAFMISFYSRGARDMGFWRRGFRLEFAKGPSIERRVRRRTAAAGGGGPGTPSAGRRARRSNQREVSRFLTKGSGGALAAAAVVFRLPFDEGPPLQLGCSRTSVHPPWKPCARECAHAHSGEATVAAWLAAIHQYTCHGRSRVESPLTSMTRI